MKVVHKYPINLDATVIVVPRGSKLVWAEATSPQQLFVWIEKPLDDEEDMATIDLRVAGTGHQVPELWQHRFTVRDGIFVWHIYERTRP